MSVGDLITREERPPYVRFERQVVEDKAASLAAGHYVGKDVDFVLITPPGSKDEMIAKVGQWFENTERNVRDGRMNPKWLELWKEGYARWKNGQEMPLNGTAIRGWGLISPAQQETLIRMHVMTIEDLSAINDEGMKRIGMGALDLKNKAKAWLQSVKDHGPLVSQVTELEKHNKILLSQIETLGAQVAALRNGQTIQPQAVARSEEITAADLLEDEPLITDFNRGETTETKSVIVSMTPSEQDERITELKNSVAIRMKHALTQIDATPTEQYEAKFGKKPHHRMLPESILAALKD